MISVGVVILMRRPVKLWLRLQQGQKGFTLIETLVGVAIFAAIGVALMNGLSTGYKSLEISQERTYAEGLAKSQVEHIKAQDYISVVNYDPNDPVKRYAVIDIPAHLVAVGYSVEINAPEIVQAAGVSGYELQSITIKVKRDGSGILVITFYRTGLAL
jgi:prepilin-type N-terminal cleavage/methylation domain-containing protein